MTVEPQLVETFRVGVALLQHMVQEGILGVTILGTVFGRATVYPSNLANIINDNSPLETSEGNIQSLEAGFREIASALGANIPE